MRSWMPSRLLAVAATLLFATSGCARLSTVTEVSADGSMTRTVTLKGMGNSPAGGMGGGGGSPELLVEAPKGPDWKTTRGTAGDELIFTATRTVPAGEVVRDVVLRDEPPKPADPADGVPAPSATPAPPAQTKPGKATRPAQKQAKPAVKPAPKPAPKPLPKVGRVLITNEVSVREIAPGRLEYREVLRWNGARPKDLAKGDEELAATLKSALPPALASDSALIAAMQKDIQRSFFRLLMGPGADPIFATFLTHQDLAEYRIRQRLASAVVASVATNIGDRLPSAERKAVSDKLIADMSKAFAAQTKSKAGPPDLSAGGEEDKDESGPLVAVFVRVKMPGKVVETNGEYDPLTGEVIWPMYSQAVALEDVTLTAICEIAK